MNNILQRLQEAEKSFADSEKRANNLEGQIEAIKKNVKVLTGTDDIRKAEKIIQEWETELQKKETELSCILDEIESAING